LPVFNILLVKDVPGSVNDKNSKIFYGYFVVGASVIILMVAWGANRTFGVFLEPMLKEFGWTRAAISGSFTLNMLVMEGRLWPRESPFPADPDGGRGRPNRKPARPAHLSFHVDRCFSILLLAKNLGLLYLFAVLYGLGLWATASLLSPLVAELFGLRSHATLYSWTVFTSCIAVRPARFWPEPSSIRGVIIILPFFSVWCSV